MYDPDEWRFREYAEGHTDESPVDLSGREGVPREPEDGDDAKSGSSGPQSPVIVACINCGARFENDPSLEPPDLCDDCAARESEPQTETDILGRGGYWREDQ